MSDERREPLEPELIPAPPRGGYPEPSGPFGMRSDAQGGHYIPIPRAPRPPRWRLAIIMFALTVLSTIFAGFGQFVTGTARIDPKTGERHVSLDIIRSSRNALTYSLGVMTILLCHEMGHYLQSRRYGVPASPPFFIPFPISPIGTMGAVIVQQQGVADRKAMFDIAISGPIAGLIVALPVAWWGISQSHVVDMHAGGSGYTDPLILKWIIRYHFGSLQPNQDIALNPLTFAGWVGVFITGLNLIPIGQLDGGHMLYCLIGKKAHTVARALFYFAIFMVAKNVLQGNSSYLGWILMLGLIWVMGTQHPPTANDSVPLGPVRIVLGWLTLAFIFVGFTPQPSYEVAPEATPRTPIEHEESEVETFVRSTRLNPVYLPYDSSADALVSLNRPWYPRAGSRLQPVE